jgi:hypothetical protein
MLSEDIMDWFMTLKANQRSHHVLAVERLVANLDPRWHVMNFKCENYILV